MKITKIELKDFHQFKDLTIDLTYPAGHDKAGQPLDKVCFIGQSGTGKTTLLELIPKFLASYNTNLINRIGTSNLIGKVKMSILFGKENEYGASLYFNYKIHGQKNKITRIWSNLKFQEKESAFEVVPNYYSHEWYSSIASKLIYLPANIDYDISKEELHTLKETKIIDFSKDKVSILWDSILSDIREYQEQELQIRQEISKTVEQSSNDLEVIKQSLKKLEDWKKTEFNPIKDIANKCLDNLLKSFKLKVDTEAFITNKDDIGFIKIKNMNNVGIPYELWSTGTKQIVLSAAPLYKLKPKHTVILFDEPERSLYPDLQRLIIDFYSSLTENCQFFYSTHSPIIASSFEPWEIVELKFNEEGHIYRELYFEGENHVDNYKYNPRLMRWDDILQRIFDMKDDGSPKRKEKLDELAVYNVKYRKLTKQNQQETDDAKQLLEQIETLSKELAKWD